MDVERIATTPERFLHALRDSSPFPALPYGQAPAREPGARDAFDAALAFLDTARAPGTAPATFLLDEFLELRTFESFPGLRSVLRDLIGALGVERQPLRADQPLRRARALACCATRRRSSKSSTSRRSARPKCAPRCRARTTTITCAAPAMSAPRTKSSGSATNWRGWSRRSSDGRPSYARAIAETATSMDARGGADPVSALAALLAPGGQLAQSCRFCYELRLHRARGYGALKAILEVLAQEEPLTLTEIAQRLQRTPGSTKDYLSWLEDVDLIVSRQKRYSFADPMLRLWVRLHCRAGAPRRRRHRARTARLRAGAPAPRRARAGARRPTAEREKSWGIIEID